MAEIKFEKLTAEIGRLTLSNSARRNALNAKMWAELPKVLAAAKQDSALRVLIVRGEGGHFSSGVDITEFESLYATPESAKKISDSISRAFKALAEFPLPTIAQIAGTCMGGGCALALCCDIRFADATAKFALPPAKLGLAYPFADLGRLIATVGVANAKDMLFSARTLNAKQARKTGLINSVFKVDNLDASVLNYGLGVSALSPQSLRISKQMFAAHSEGQNGEVAQSEDWFLAGFNSDDFKEGYTAFLQKRPPKF